MSRHGPRRPPPLDTGLRPGPGPRRPSGSPARHGYYGSGSAESALGILSGCGLEPARSALLAQLPEESPPHLVRPGQSNREALQPPRLPSSPKPPVGRRHRDAGRSVRHALDGVEPTPLPAERLHDGPGHWQNPPSGAPLPHALTRRDPPSLSTRNLAASVSSLLSLPRDRPSAPRAEGRWGSGWEGGHPEASSRRLAGAATPSKREARDFHGAEPQTYPTSCSLCNACVMSAENWTTHINSGRHADGQLGLLQRFPTWDCRMETLDRADRRSEKRTRKDGGPLRQSGESGRSQPPTSSEKKPAQRAKVACVKFAAGSVDEPRLRKLTEPFGTVTRMLVFPSLAFVELESAEQAQELVKFHKRRPPTASGRRLHFSISNTFNFVRHSRVVSFTPPPQSDDDKSDLLAVVERFGAPVDTLFCRSEACVEMKSLEDAEKLVRYYASDDLRLNDKVLRVAFAAESSTLRSAASAQRYREESTESGEEDRVPEESEERRAEGREGASGSGSGSGSGGGTHSRKSQTGSPSGEREARSGSREKTCRSGARTADAEKPETTASKASGGEQERSDADTDSEQDGSDIEGMAVLGEDDEDLEDDRLETEEEADEPTPKGEERPVGGDSPEAAGGPLPGADGGKRDEGRRPGNAAEEEPSDEEAVSEDGTTSDKAGRERSGAAGEGRGGGSGDEDEDERHASRVVYFKDLPLSYCNAGDFVKLAKGLGTPVRYHLMRRLQKGFLELSRSREAIAVASQLSVYFENTQTLVLISDKYRRLPNGSAVPRDESGERRRRRNSRRDKEESKAGSEASSKSDRGKEKKARETPERDDATRNSADVLSSSHSNWGNAQDGPGSGKAPPVTSDAGKKTTRDGNAHGGRSKDEKAPPNNFEDGKTLDSQSDNGATPEAPSQGGKTAQVKPQGGDTQSEGRHPLQDESKARKRRKEESESRRRNSLQRESKCRKTDECDSEAGKDAAAAVLFSRVSQRVSAQDPGGAHSRQEDDSAGTLERRASPEDACVRGKIQKEEQRSQTSAETDENQEAGGTSATPATPLRPVGTGFVRPVVGYFCNLCQVIYADEDEAKVRHCSSRRHHLKYRERMESAT